MNRKIAWLALFAAGAVFVTVAVPTARADDQVVAFHMHNYLDQAVGVWIEPDKDGTIRLGSPDRFIIAVDVGEQRSRSKPVAIKAFLAKHPDYVLKLSASHILGAQAGHSGGLGSIQRFYLAPAKPENNNPSKTPVQVPQLDFQSVPQQ
jgi:hypothetical protein